MDNAVCSICDNKKEGEWRTLKKKAIEKLIVSSKARSDSKYVHWKKVTELQVHYKCQSSYNSDSAIKTAKKEHGRKSAEGKKLLKEAYNFDFQSLCFFCGCNYNVKNGSVSHVQSPQTLLKIRNTLSERGTPDEFNKTVSTRLGKKSLDLVAENAWYHWSCMTKFYNWSACKDVGRPTEETTKNFIEYAIQYIDRYETEAQFTLEEIKEDFIGEIPHLKQIKYGLQKHYGDEIDFKQEDTNNLYISFRHKIKKEEWVEWTKKKLDNNVKSRQEIVKMAAKIILEDIRESDYDKNNYVLQDFNTNNIYDNIPSSLISFLTEIITNHKKSVEKKKFNWQKKIATVSHVIITQARPRSFLSPILLGLSSVNHKKYGSRDLIDSLSHIGLGVSYDETLRFEASIAKDPERYSTSAESFLQFVFDNADHDTCTLDGKGTFHKMGCILVATPSSSVTIKKTFRRIKRSEYPSLNGKPGYKNLKTYVKGNGLGLKSVQIQNVFKDDAVKLKLHMEDFFWLFSKHSNDKSKGYGGFMEDFFVTSKYQTSAVIPEAFIDGKADDYTTIFTALVQAAEENERINKERRKKGKKDLLMFVTFDQPLYQKARYILSSVDPQNDPYALRNIRVRLGGFHVLMSFLGSIGFIMAGSGLLQAFEVIYAKNSAEKALGGKAVARAIRGHTLIQVSLAKKIFKSLGLTDEETNEMIKCLKNLGKVSFKSEIEREEFILIRDRFTKKLEEFQKKGPTAKLWTQYWDMLMITKNFIKAERSGNWDLHLKCIKEMLPYFHASGHNKYSKSAHLYLQDMSKLIDEMDDFQFEAFTSEGFFTVRRSDKFWCGVWTDMTIEQVLMRGIAATGGGLAHRGFGNTAVGTYVETMTVMINLCNIMENFCDVAYISSEQHVDSSDARITRDAADLKKLDDYFDKHNPFPDTQNIMSIFTGIEGGDSINCHKAYDVGIKAIEKITDNNFETATFTRTTKVSTLQTVNSSIKINEKPIAIDPLVLFQRICINIEKKGDMEDYLKYELAPFPMSLFTENGFRKNVKSQLFEEFTSTNVLPSTDNLLHVIDGGFLLHKVLWKKDSTIEEIIEKYLHYIQRHYTSQSYIVFDGYSVNDSDNVCSSTPATKTAERMRRSKTCSVPHLSIMEPQTKVPYLQEKFLSNEQNKNDLIQKLIQRFRREQYTCKQAEEDADSLIIETAMSVAEKWKQKFQENNIAENNKTVVVVGQDIDLLILLTQSNSIHLNLYFFKPGAGNVSDCFYSPTNFKHKDCSTIATFLHCFSGCDTTSAIAGKGKKTVFHLLRKTPNLTNLVDPFYQPNADPKVIANNGCTLMKSVYKCTNSDDDLNKLRYKQYTELSKKPTFKLEKIPPTVGAATQHSYRVYYQVQKWLGNILNATDWGWELREAGKKKILMPRLIPSNSFVIPENLLKTISCTCATGCGIRCGCRKLNLNCTDLCTKCQDNCTNTEQIVESSFDLEDLLNDEEESLNLSSNIEYDHSDSEDAPEENESQNNRLNSESINNADVNSTLEENMDVAMETCDEEEMNSSPVASADDDSPIMSKRQKL